MGGTIHHHRVTRWVCLQRGGSGPEGALRLGEEHAVRVPKLKVSPVLACLFLAVASATNGFPLVTLHRTSLTAIPYIERRRAGRLPLRDMILPWNVFVGTLCIPSGLGRCLSFWVAHERAYTFPNLLKIW